MGCPKNIKHHKFLWWKWDTESNHRIEIEYIDKFMRYDDDFVVHWHCPLCEMRKKQHFVEYQDLIRMGLTKEEIDKITDWDSWKPIK